MTHHEENTALVKMSDERLERDCNEGYGERKWPRFEGRITMIQMGVLEGMRKIIKGLGEVTIKDTRLVKDMARSIAISDFNHSFSATLSHRASL